MMMMMIMIMMTMMTCLYGFVVWRSRPPGSQQQICSRSMWRPAWDRRTDRRTDGRTPDRCIDHAPNTMRAVPIRLYTNIIFIYLFSSTDQYCAGEPAVLSRQISRPFCGQSGPTHVAAIPPRLLTFPAKKPRC